MSIQVDRNDRIISLVEHEPMEGDPERSYSLGATESLDSITNTIKSTQLARGVSRIIRERMLRPQARGLLRNLTFNILEVSSNGESAKCSYKQVLTPRLGEMTIGKEWAHGQSISLLKWEEQIFEQSLRISGSDQAITLAEVDLNQVLITEDSDTLISERYAYWYDPSDEEPVRNYRKQFGDTDNPTRTKRHLDANITMELIYNLSNAEKIR